MTAGNPGGFVQDAISAEGRRGRRASLEHLHDLHAQGPKVGISAALQAGAQGYLLKESAGAEVVQAIRTVHAGGRYLSPQISDQVIDYYLDPKDATTGDPPLERLSPREREILQLVVEGKTSADIGEILFISAKTVDSYRSRLMEKLGLKDLPSLVKFAIQQGLTSVD